MPTFARVARHIEQLIAADPANADRIRELLPEATSTPAPRKRAAKAAAGAAPGED
jgi:hypothetical protein